MLEQNPQQAERWRPGIVVDERQAANFAQDFAEQSVELRIIGEKRNPNGDQVTENETES